MKRNVCRGAMFVVWMPLKTSVFIKLGFISRFVTFQGITFDEFRSFFQFLNNLEDFAIAMQMYNFASRSIGQGESRSDRNWWSYLRTSNAVCKYKVTEGLFMLLLTDEFARAVYVATGQQLTRHLVHTIFKIFDVDHDDQLSYKEFIGIMKDRLHRGARVRKRNSWKKKSMVINLWWLKIPSLDKIQRCFMLLVKRSRLFDIINYNDND